MKPVILLSFSIILFNCGQKKEDASGSRSYKTAIPLKYAEGFTIRKEDRVIWLDVLRPFQGASQGHTYLLVPHGEQVPDHDASVKVIRTPIQSIACTSTTHIPLLDYLDESDKLRGFPSTDYISSAKTRKFIDEGNVTDLGIDKGLNLELLASIKPDVLMGYTMSADYGQFKKIEQLGIPVVINAEYLEKHPLGRAEWIKFMAAFFHKTERADSIFQMIEKNYLDTKSLTETTTTHKPTVLSGVLYGDAWFLPGGQNYAARIIKDASCHYLWQQDSSSGYLELSFEAVFERARESDLWIGVGSYASLDEIRAADHRYGLFKPFREKTIYNYDAKLGAKGGNEFLELGYLRPDIILKDLVKIAHPQLLPDHELYFYRKLR